MEKFKFQVKSIPMELIRRQARRLKLKIHNDSISPDCCIVEGSDMYLTNVDDPEWNKTGLEEITEKDFMNH